MEGNDKEEKDQSALGINDQENHQTGNGTDNGAKEGNDVGTTDNDSDEDGKRDLQKETKAEAHDPNDDTIQNLAHDKAGENVVGLCADPHEPVRVFLGEKGVEKLSHMSDEIFFAGQHINGRDQGCNTGNKAVTDGHTVVQKLGELGGDELGGGADNVLIGDHHVVQ